ncbi:hypothetical protein AAG906_009253 [Vitis piasezkii]
MRSKISDDYVVYLQEHEFDMGLEDDPISKSSQTKFLFEKWIEAMKDEMKSMKDNSVWDLVELLKGVKPISYSFRIIMTLVTHYDLELHQMDVKTVFLNGNIDETIYMVQSENFESNDSKQLQKRVMRYLQRTKDYMLTYYRSSHLEIMGYSDSDFAGCLDNRRSTSSYIFMLVGGAVSWKSVKQTLIASSTMEAEFIACYEASNHGIWLWNFVTRF